MEKLLRLSLGRLRVSREKLFLIFVVSYKFLVPTNISAMELQNADEVFTATTAGGIVPVTRVDGRILSNDAAGEVAQKILDTYWDFHKRPDLNTEIIYK